LQYDGKRRPTGYGLLGSEDHWQQTPWGRIVVGLVLSQGLYYGLQHLCTAGLLAAGDAAGRSAWATLTGLIWLQGLLLCGLLVGGMLAGVGKRQGIVFGAVVGVWNAVLYVLVQYWNGHHLNQVAMYGQPILQTAFGAMGGFLGSAIWRPPPILTMPAPPRGLASLGWRSSKPSAFAGPVAWTRVLTGAAVTVGGVVWANVILEFVLEASEGKLTIDSHLQAQLVTWEICALAMLTGSSLAGANTANGIKQGLCVGLGAGTVLTGVQLGSASFVFETAVLTVISTVALGLVGGWFGGQLWPPLYAAPRRERMRPATI
jgi:hypothetical protein